MTPYILTLSCPDKIGIVAAVATFLAERQGNITASAQYNDRDTGQFFMRVEFDIANSHTFRRDFSDIAGRFDMQWNLHSLKDKPRLVIMVSQFGHCLNDLLFRNSTGLLNAEIVAVISNHSTFQNLSTAYQIPFFHLPVSPHNKTVQEQELVRLLLDMKTDCVVLARYMQILSSDLCRAFEGRMINIHHSFLPSFKGASPYTQAHQKGVKLIGATAHYVTPELDEGPIIEQDVTRVDHTMDVEHLMSAGRDVECSVLARAVKFHIEHRILLNGTKTIVFR